jgi:TonB family protein
VKVGKPHRNSPVQPGRSDVGIFVFLAVVACGAIWLLSDTWPPPDDAAYDREAAEGPGDRMPAAQPARGDLASLFSGDDYPLEALSNEEQGTVAVHLQVEPSGRVGRCTVAVSSGSSALDRKTCEILQERARFSPALDGEGHPVVDHYTQRITWRLE